MLQPGLLLVHTCLEVSRLQQAAMKVNYDGKSQTPCGKDVAAQHVCLLRMEALATGLLRAWIKLCEDVVERTEGRQIHILKV